MDYNYHMNLYLNKESSLESIQQKFNEYYPFLKIVFFKHYAPVLSLPKALMITAAESAKKLDNTYDGSLINIQNNRTVFEIEKELEKLFGLSALVFRKSGNVWVETSLTDDWTLEAQNNAGEQISGHFK